MMLFGKMSEIKSHLVKKIILSIISILFTFISIFILDRKLGIKSNNSKLLENRQAIYRTPEFTFISETNSKGFRGNEFEIEKKENTVRILAIGDSFTYCWGVDYENCWVSRLEKSLNSLNNQLSVEVLNLGIPGASLYDYLETSKKYIPLYKPDYVFIGVVEGNDFVQLIVSAEIEWKQPSRRLEIKRRKMLEEMDKMLNKQSDITEKYKIISTKLFPNIQHWLTKDQVFDVRQVFINDVRNYISKLTEEEIDSFNLKVSEEMKEVMLTGGVNPELFLYSRRIPEYFVLALKKEDPRYIKGAQKMEELLIDIFKVIKDNGSIPVVIDLPYGVFVSKYHMDTFHQMGFDNDEMAWQSDLPVNLIKKSVNESAKLIINLQIFRKKCGNDCFWRYDDHLTNKGNLILAENIFNQIKSFFK